MPFVGGGDVVFEIHGVAESVVMKIGGAAASMAADSGDEVGVLLTEVRVAPTKKKHPPLGVVKI